MIEPHIIKTYPSLTSKDCVTAFVSGTSPSTILNYDNNLEIALNLIKPRNFNDLRNNGITVLESQELLLKLWGMVEDYEENKYHFSLPVLIGKKLDTIRRTAKKLASFLLEKNKKGINDYLDGIRQHRWQSHQFTFLASLVLDGMIWSQMSKLDLVTNLDFNQMETGSRYWSGLAWVTYPAKTFRLGTNTYTLGNYNFNQSWTPASWPQQSLVTQFHREALVKFIDRGRLSLKTKEQTELEKLGFISKGECTIPVITHEDTIYKQGLNLANQIVQVLRNELESLDIVKLVGPDFRTALIILFHEVYPVMLEMLIEQGLELPGILGGLVNAPLATSFYISKDDSFQS